MMATALRERLPRVAEVFTTGVISYRLVAAVVARTRLVTDRAARAELDAALAAQVAEWGAWSVAKAEAGIDAWVDRIDPYALRRGQSASRTRHLDVAPPDNGTGVAYLEGKLFAQAAAVLDRRLAAMARAV